MRSGFSENKVTEKNASKTNVLRIVKYLEVLEQTEELRVFNMENMLAVYKYLK